MTALASTAIANAYIEAGIDALPSVDCARSILTAIAADGQDMRS